MDSHAQHIVEHAVAFVRKRMEGEGSGHDWWHIDRVYRMAMHLAAIERADKLIVALAALLHDIADYKFHDGDTSIGPRIAHEWMAAQGVDAVRTDQVAKIITDLSFKGAGVPTPMATLEGKVVQDADRLDAIGAIGIARAFAYGGYKNREIFNPDIPAIQHDSFDDYKKNQSTTINHFHEKLLLLKDRMNTDTARHIAAARPAYMQAFLLQFEHEWRMES